MHHLASAGRDVSLKDKVVGRQRQCCRWRCVAQNPVRIHLVRLRIDFLSALEPTQNSPLIFGMKSLCFISFFPMSLHFFTATVRFPNPYFVLISRSTDACETNTMEFFCAARGSAPHIGLALYGCTVGILPLASPICRQRTGGSSTYMRPSDDSAFDDEFGFCSEILWFPHNQIGQTPFSNLTHDMRHAVCDGADVSAIRVGTHGLMVYFAMYRFTRTLSFFSESPSSDPLT